MEPKLIYNWTPLERLRDAGCYCPEWAQEKWGHTAENLNAAQAEIQAEIATLRQWDARKPEVQAKVLDAWSSKIAGWYADCLRTGKRPPLKLESE